jgi:hypothetical protein
MTSRILLLGALALAVASLAACSSLGLGPLGDGGTDGQQCMDFPAGQPVTIGLFDLANSGGSPVTIRSVSFPPRRAWL